MSAARLGSTVVGREAELAAVAAFLDAGAVGPAALLVEGEAGIGKTTIVAAALDTAACAGLRVLVARPAEGEAELPFAALGDLLSGLGDDALARLAAPQRQAIEVALGRSDGGASEHALSRGLLELLRGAAVGGDLLLVVDDAQWLDRPTSSALSFALRRLGTAPLRVLIAVRRPDGAAVEPPLGVAEWELRRLVVGPLSVTELGAMLRDRLGEQLPRPRVAAVHRSSGGNPMFALELARRPEGARVDGTTLTGAVAERLRALDPRERTAVSFAATALRPTTDLLLRAGVERAGLHAALASGVLEFEADRVRFVHPLLGSVAYELLLPDERREFHARLAAVSVDVSEHGHHVARSAVAPDEAAAATLEQAAELAAARGDHAGAAAFLLRAAELTPEPAGEAANWREARAAEQLALAGGIAAAGALARSLVERVPAGACRAEARLTGMLCAVGSEMSYEDALAELTLAIDDGEGDDELQARMHVAVTETLLGLGRFSEAVRHVGTAVQLAERAGAQAVIVTALGYLGVAEAALGFGVTASSRRALEQWDGSVILAGSYSPRMALAFACLQASAFEESEQLFDEETAAAAENGLETMEITARGHLAQAQLRSGRWAAALANARLAVEHARQAANPQVLNGACSALAMAEALLGNHARARALATEGLGQAEVMNDFWVSLYHRGALGLVALAEDNPQEAVDVLQPGWQLMVERDLGDPSMFAVAHALGESYVTLGRHPDARAIADWLRSCPAAARSWCRAMTGRLDALLASAAGNHIDARAAIATAFVAHEELQDSFEHARTLLVEGRVERSARNWGAARAAFTEALERFDELGAARWSEKAAAELARLPGRRPAADTNGLTAREREIATLAAAGLANKEVAARLFVSVHTIEATLSRVYAKLGIRSRSELAGRLDAAKL